MSSTSRHPLFVEAENERYRLNHRSVSSILGTINAVATTYGASQMVSQTEDFDFDPDKTTEDNITRFFGFLSADEPDFAELLLDAVQELTPMPDDANRRRSARAKANQIVLQALDEVEN